MRFIKQVTSFVEGASIAHRKVRGNIFQERVGCEQKSYYTYRHMAMIKAANANLMTLGINAPYAFPFSFAVSSQTSVTHKPLFAPGFFVYVPVCSAPVVISTPAVISFLCHFPVYAFLHHAASS